MITDNQVRILMKLVNQERLLKTAAAKAGMSEKTARKYRKSGKLPSQCKVVHDWRTSWSANQYQITPKECSALDKTGQRDADRSYLVVASKAFYEPFGRFLRVFGWMRYTQYTHIISRMRRDANIYDLPPKQRSKRRGRPRKKGKKLSCREIWPKEYRTGS